MNALKLAGVLLLFAGSLALVYGGFSYTSDSQRAKIGSLKVLVTEQAHVAVPVWAGLGAMVLGGLLLVTARKAS